MIFAVVFLIKIIFGTLFASHYLRDLFIPFINYFVTSGFHNPWDFFLAEGNLKAFPYPSVMLWIFSVSRFLASPFVSNDWKSVTLVHFFIMRIPLLLSDLAIFAILSKWFKNHKAVLYVYWCSPIVFYICYFHGQLDIVPTALLFVALHLLYIQKFDLAAVFFGVALGAKSHIMAALPFVAIYLYRTQNFRTAARFLLMVTGLYLLTLLPYIQSEGFQTLVLKAEEQKWVFKLAFWHDIGQLRFFICPAILLLLFFRFAYYPKLNWDMLILYLGITFSAFIMLVPPMQGWYMWSIPFITYFYCRDKAISRIPLIVFSVSYLLFFLGKENSDLFDSFQVLSPKIAELKSPYFNLLEKGWDADLMKNVLFTVLETSVAAMIGMMYLSGVRSNEIYRPRIRPVMIGISGDSGAGKHTLVSLIENLFGKDNVLSVNGDDYHKWPRGNENWQVMTPLNAKSNQLHDQLDHAVAIKEGDAVMKVEYDHRNGHFTNPRQIDPKKIVIFVGLHSLFLDKMRRIYDLKIFLNPHETLRSEWKIKRDTDERGYTKEQVSAELSRRKGDRLEHILPQMKFANMIVRFEPISKSKDLRLVLELENSYDYHSILNQLNSETDLKIEQTESADAVIKQVVSFQGQISKETLDSIAENEIPNLQEISLSRLQFEDNLNGILQLFFLMCLSSELRWKPKT